MRKTVRTTFTIAILAGLLASCGGPKTKGTSSATAGNGVLGQDDAKEVLLAHLAKKGADPNIAAVTSMEEALEVMEKDTITRFDGAQGFLGSQSGAKPMAMNAQLHACHSETLKYLAFALEAQTRMKEEKRIHLEGKKEQGLTVNEKDEAFLTSVQEVLKEEREVIEAMRILAVSRLLRAQEITSALSKKHPEEPSGILAAAHVSLLKGEWKKYDALMAELDEETAQGFEAGHLRAMEELARQSSPEKAAQLLEKLRKNHPKKVRTTAMLLMILHDEKAAEEKLSALEKIAPDHMAAIVLGGWLTRS